MKKKSCTSSSCTKNFLLVFKKKKKNFLRAPSFYKVFTYTTHFLIVEKVFFFLLAITYGKKLTGAKDDHIFSGV
jgi:hypothetical protein